MSEYTDKEMRWSKPRGSAWDRLYGKRARRQLCNGGAFGKHSMVVGGRDGQERCRGWEDVARFVEP